MSEDDELQNALMQDSSQMIEFLLSTIHRAATLCRSRKSKQETGKDKLHLLEDSAESENKKNNAVDTMEMQSLTTALSLLRTYVVGGKLKGRGSARIKISGWAALQHGLEDLKILEECYSDKDIRVIAGKLRHIIDTNGAILRHNEKIRANANSIQMKTEELQTKILEFKSLVSQSCNKTLDPLLKSENVDEIINPILINCDDGVETSPADKDNALFSHKNPNSKEVLSLKILAKKASEEKVCPPD